MRLVRLLWARHDAVDLARCWGPSPVMLQSKRGVLCGGDGCISCWLGGDGGVGSLSAFPLVEIWG